MEENTKCEIKCPNCQYIHPFILSDIINSVSRRSCKCGCFFNILLDDEMIKWKQLLKFKDAISFKAEIVSIYSYAGAGGGGGSDGFIITSCTTSTSSGSSW
jgi:hypothetical protein